MQTPWLPRSLTIFWLGQPTREMERIWGAPPGAERIFKSGMADSRSRHSPDFRHAEEFLLQIFPPQLHSPGKARDLGRGFSAAGAALLPAAGQQRLWIPDPGTDVQSADALGPADLVGGDGEEVRPQRFCGALDLQKSDRVGVQQRHGFFTARPGRSQRMDRCFPARCSPACRTPAPCPPDGGEDLLRREGSRPEPGQDTSPRIPAAPSSRLHYGAVLHCGGNDVAAVAVLPAGGSDSPVVRLPCRRR